MRLTAAFVHRWSAEYWTRSNATERTLEEHLLDEVGPNVAERGYYKKAELIEVGKWKARGRIRKRIDANSEEDVSAISEHALAVGTPDYVRHWSLQRLKGVGSPMASALLSVWAPQRFTVLDFRAAQALLRLGELPGPDETPDYPTYLHCCREIAQRLGVALRQLDRALWTWHAAGMPD
jgi:hypothetical protein